MLNDLGYRTILNYGECTKKNAFLNNICSARHIYFSRFFIIIVLVRTTVKCPLNQNSCFMFGLNQGSK